MSRSKSRHSASADTKGTRLAVAQTFVNGDRVRHRLTGKMGVFAGINLGFALPEVWVVFDSDTGSRIPISCNPLDLELVQKDCTEHQVFRELEMLGDTQVYKPLQDLEVVEELVGSSPDHLNEAETQPISQEVRDIADTVDVTPVAAVEVVEELSEEEVAQRHRLEIKVERAFREAGLALKELKDRKLYRSTHRTFEDYCRDRFGFERRHPYRLINAAVVIENLEEFCVQFGHILPTKESICRPLTALTPDRQRQVWREALAETDGKHPTGQLIKGIVERLKEKPLTKTSNFCQVGDVFTLSGLEGTERKYNGCWAIAIVVNDFTVVVDVHNGNLAVKPDNLKRIDEPDVRRQMPAILKRIRRLRNCGLLDRVAYTILESLGRQTYLTEMEEKVLTFLEQQYKMSE